MTQDSSFAVDKKQDVTVPYNVMSTVKFTHLHLHTPWSLLDGFCRIDDLLDLAIEYGMDAVGVSEHGNCHSHIEFYTKAKKKGIKPILGCEVYVTPNRHWKKEDYDSHKEGFWINKKQETGWRPNMAHLLLIAKNNEGYQNLLELTSRAYLEGFYFKPRTDYELLKQYGKGIIATTACFLPDARVLTQDGLKEISQVESGDLVTSHLNNQKSVVVPTTRYFNGNIHTIQTKGSSFNITATDNHQFFVVPHQTSKTVAASSLHVDEDMIDHFVSQTSPEAMSKSKRQNYKIYASSLEPVWKEARELTTDYDLLTPIDETVQDFDVIDISFARHSRATNPLKAYSIPVDEKLLKILGLFAAEGHVSSGNHNKMISFTFNQEKEMHLVDEVADYFLNVFGIKGLIYERPENKKVSISFTNIELWTLFLEWFGRLSNQKRMPLFIKHLPREKQIHFLRGYFIGDGYAQQREDARNPEWSSTRVIAATVSQQLTSDIVHLLHRLWINPLVREVEEKVDTTGIDHQRCYYIEINGPLGKAFADFVWNDHDLIIPMELRRAKDIPFCWKNNLYMKQSIVKNNATPYNGDVYCLNVKDDHSFVVEGVIAHNCLGGEVPQLIRKGKTRVAKNIIRFYQECFDELYLEIQPSDMPEQILVNETFKVWSKEMNIPLVATSDAHMLRKEEKPIHAALTTIGRSEDTSDISVYEHCYFMSAQEMLDFGIPAEALENAYEIGKKCNVDLSLGDIKLPKFEVPEGFEFDSYLSHLCNSALFQLALEKDIDIEKYQERMQFELEVIANKGFSAYFLIVWDYIKYAKDNGILVGPGRGSGAGSLVAYLLGIVNIDPMKYDLLFEREKKALVKSREFRGSLSLVVRYDMVILSQAS